MDGINEIIPIKVTVLSPIHIGSGKTANIEMETLEKENGIIAFLSLDKLLEEVASNKRLLYELSRKIAGESREPLEKIIPANILKKSEIYTVKDRRSSRYSRDLKTFIRDARNVPFIPGSSLKGALRTLVFSAYLKEHEELLNAGKFESNRRDRRKSNYNPEEKVFGKDAQKDPMKILKTEDIYFGNENISLRTVKMFDLSNDGTRCGFKKMGRNGELTSTSSATPINVEALNEKTVLNGEIAIDKYYANKTLNGNSSIDAEWFGTLFKDFFQILSVSSKYESLEYIESELEFFKKYGSNCDVRNVIDFYENLKSEVEKSKNTIYLKMAWGIGWKGMTGNVYHNGLLSKIVSGKNLSRGRNAVVFPKTRRLFTERGPHIEFAVYPAGWLKIERR